MKKTILVIVGLFLVTSVASANPTQTMNFSSMSKIDTQFLFDGSAKTIILTNQGMKQTEGEFWNIAFYVAIFTVQYLNTLSYNKQIYSGYPYAKPRMRWFQFQW